MKSLYVFSFFLYYYFLVFRLAELLTSPVSCRGITDLNITSTKMSWLVLVTTNVDFHEDYSNIVLYYRRTCASFWFKPFQLFGPNIQFLFSSERLYKVLWFITETVRHRPTPVWCEGGKVSDSFDRVHRVLEKDLSEIYVRYEANKLMNNSKLTHVGPSKVRLCSDSSFLAFHKCQKNHNLTKKGPNMGCPCSSPDTACTPCMKVKVWLSSTLSPLEFRVHQLSLSNKAENLFI